jgi:phosphoglycolate phosphatase-like HAD superfamily hydrolase
VNTQLERHFGSGRSHSAVLDRALDRMALTKTGWLGTLVERGLSSSERTFSQISQALKDSGIRTLLVDFDGCVIPVNGKVHGWIAAKALQRVPDFRTFAMRNGVVLTLEEAEAAYVGNTQFLKDAFLSRASTLAGFSVAQHGVPWDTLMATNLVGNILNACGASTGLTQNVIADFHAATKEVGQDLSSGALSFESKILPQPHFVPFLAHLAREGLELHVVTMTPTSIVQALAREVGADPFVSSYQGCDTFSHDEFPMAKATGPLWIAAARRALKERFTSMNSIGIVEDNLSNMQGAKDSGAGAFISLSPSANRALTSCDSGLRLGVVLNGEICSFAEY